METIATVFIDLSFNNSIYRMDASGYVLGATSFQWFEISGSESIYLSNSSFYDISNNFLYMDGDKLRIYKCEINANKVVYFNIIYKSFFQLSIQYPLTLIGNPIKLDISYASYILEYGNSQLLNIGDPSGGIKPYKYAWYNGATLIGGENNPTYLIQHSFDIIEPIADISKSFYCHVTNSGEALPVHVVQFDALFRSKPLPLSGIQNLSGYNLNVYEELELNIQNISGGRKPLSIVWERTYPGNDFVFYLSSFIPENSTETTLNISNTREFPINDGVITYKATLTDALGSVKTFIYNITYKGYYLSEPCIPAGTLIKAYNENNVVVDVSIENITVGTWIPSNNAKVKVQKIYIRSVVIGSGDMHILNGTVRLFKKGIVSSDGYVYNNINNVTNNFNNQTVVLYQLETPNYLKYDIIVGNKYIKSYGNHDDSLVYDGILGGYVTIYPPRDAPVVGEGNIQIIN